jgi:hypothetical protein
LNPEFDVADLSFTFDAPLWLWTGKGAWHFVTVPKDISAQINYFTQRPGFGSVRVTVQIKDLRWKTSIFPDAKSGCYFLPVKAEVRNKLGLVAGSSVVVDLHIDIVS